MTEAKNIKGEKCLVCSKPHPIHKMKLTDSDNWVCVKCFNRAQDTITTVLDPTNNRLHYAAQMLLKLTTGANKAGNVSVHRDVLQDIADQITQQTNIELTFTEATKGRPGYEKQLIKRLYIEGKIIVIKE